MKVFISWSGHPSQELAEELSNWIPLVIQAAIPFYSSHDIGKGSRWNLDLSLVLDNSKVGLICLTQNNLESPWIMFEAGALSKNIDCSKVCPILFNIEASQITGPLIQFNATKFSESEMFRMMSMLNDELSENRLSEIVLKKQFEKWWPDLNDKILKIMNETLPHSINRKRTTEDILEEVLQLTRSLSINNERSGRELIHEIKSSALLQLIDRFEKVLLLTNELKNDTLTHKMRKLFMPIAYIIQQYSIGKSNKDDFRSLISKVNVHFETEINGLKTDIVDNH